jgi:hypothetical protein
MQLQPVNLLIAAIFMAASAFSYQSPALKAANVNIGKDLQVWSTVALSQPAPAGDVQLTLTSSDPSRLLLSKAPEAAGTASITLTVRARFRESPEFWLQALGDSGQVNFTAAAPGYETATGTATLSPSGIIMIGPMGEQMPEFVTTPRGWPTKVTLRTVRLNDSLQKMEPQYVRGGFSVEVGVQSSHAQTGQLEPSTLTIPAAADMAAAIFKPAAVGKTVLAVRTPPGFRVPASLHSLAATVKVPGMAVADDLVLGENLQLPVAFSLGEPAPAEGVTARITSNDPKRLLLSTSPTETGKPAIDLRVPGGGVTATYYIQSLSRSGTVTHQAVAPDYAPRTGTITLAPSGVILSLEKHGPPDEAELFRPESAGSHRNLFVALLSETKPHPLIVYTAFLDPKTRRSADITVQQLRAGLSLSVGLKNSNPGIAAIEPKTEIKGGSDRALIPFKALRTGETIIAVETPNGFTTPSNATELQVIVRD